MSVMGPLPEGKGSEPPLKEGEAVIAQESDCNGRQDPEKYLRYIEPCQASQHEPPPSIVACSSGGSFHFLQPGWLNQTLMIENAKEDDARDP